MQRGENEVAGFRGFESDFDRFTVAHLAYEYDFRRLAQRGAQGECESGGVAVQLALMDGGFFVAMQKFYGIFDGENMKSLIHIHFVDNSGQGGGFAGAGGAGHQDDAVFDVNDLSEARWQLQVVETWNFIGDDAHNDGATAALAED